MSDGRAPVETVEGTTRLALIPTAINGASVALASFEQLESTVAELC